MPAEHDRLTAIARLAARMIDRGSLDGIEMQQMHTPDGWAPKDLQATIRYTGRGRQVEVSSTEASAANGKPSRVRVDVDEEHDRSVAVLERLRTKAQDLDVGREL